MGTITIVGLGPGAAGNLSLETMGLLKPTLVARFTVKGLRIAQSIETSNAKASRRYVYRYTYNTPASQLMR